MAVHGLHFQFEMAHYHARLFQPIQVVTISLCAQVDHGDAVQAHRIALRHQFEQYLAADSQDPSRPSWCDCIRVKATEVTDLKTNRARDCPARQQTSKQRLNS